MPITGDSSTFQKAYHLRRRYSPRWTVKWFNPNKGFGFIEQDTGDDLFVHQSEIRQDGFRFLNLGDRVEFEVGTGKKGPVALKVTRTQAVVPDKYPNFHEEPDEALINKVSETQLN